VAGSFDSIYARQVPATHPHCCLAVKIRFQKFEEGQRQLRLAIVDDDGKALLPPIDIALQVQMPPDADSNAIQVVANIAGLKLEQFGEYSIDLAINGRHEASVPLYVRRAPGAS
jgi:hypothetical protein